MVAQGPEARKEVIGRAGGCGSSRGEVSRRRVNLKPWCRMSCCDVHVPAVLMATKASKALKPSDSERDVAGKGC